MNSFNCLLCGDVVKSNNFPCSPSHRIRPNVLDLCLALFLCGRLSLNVVAQWFLQIQFLQGHELFIPQHEALEKVIVGFAGGPRPDSLGMGSREGRGERRRSGRVIQIVERNVIRSG